MIAVPVNDISNGFYHLVIIVQCLGVIIAKFLAGFDKQDLFLFAESGSVFLVTHVIALIQQRKIFFVTLEIDADNCDFPIRTQ